MDGKHRALILAPLVASGLALSGCMSSPTYGTDKTSNEQLLTDLSGALTLAPNKREAIEYKPRPPLVKPAAGQKEALPQPQDDIVQTASAQWPESPEQRRARIRDYATEHRDDPNFEPEVVSDGSGGIPVMRRNGSDKLAASPFTYQKEEASTKDEVNRRIKENNQGDPTSRKFLSEPPLTYREAASTAPQGDVGEDEYKKERRLKAQAKGKSGLFDWLPW